MPGAKRRFEPSVIARLLDEPQRFEFVQAVRMLELWLRQNGVAHDKALSGFLRFTNSVAMNFPPSELEALTPDADVPIGSARALQAALLDKTLKCIRITPAFIGFFGVNGVLPYHYSESIAARVHFDRADGQRALFDSFSSRSVALFYQSWAKYRIQYRLDAQGRDAFLPMQLALAGIKPHARDRSDDHSDIETGGVCDEVAGHYAAMLRHRPVSGAVIAGVLTEYFGVPISLEQFVGCWDDLPVAHQSRLGVANCLLGQGAVLGASCWRRDLRVRLRIGPLARRDYERFLPGASGAKALKTMLSLFAGAPLQYEVRPVLRAQAVRKICLVPDNDERGSRLGWDSYLATKPEVLDRDDMFYVLHP